MFGPEALEGFVCNTSSLRGGMLVMGGTTTLAFESGAPEGQQQPREGQQQPGEGQQQPSEPKWRELLKSVKENIIPHLRLIRDGMPARPAFLCRLGGFYFDLSFDGNKVPVQTEDFKAMLTASTNTFHVRPEHWRSIVHGMQLIMGLKSGGEVALGDACRAPILVPYSVKMEVGGQIVGSAGSPPIIMLGGGLIECGLNEMRYMMPPFAYPFDDLRIYSVL